jgi:hypothetical protein
MRSSADAVGSSTTREPARPGVAALIGWLEPKTAQLSAELVMILRIASISYVIGRVRHETVTTGTHLAAFAIALAGCLVVALKLFLT